MVSYASISWIRFVRQHLISMSHTTMSSIALIASKTSLGFLNLKVYSSQQTLIRTELLYYLTLIKTFTTKALDLFVGVRGDLNCNQFKSYARVAKKNTQISRLGVLNVVCYQNNTDWYTDNPILAHRIYRCNFFAECYV
jgi:hypothetical protein